MKISLPLLLIVVCMLCFCGCTKFIYNQEILQDCHTKDDVTKQFGSPDEIKQGLGGTQLIYYKDSIRYGENFNKRDVVIYSYSNTASDSIPTNNKRHARYIKFIIDTDGRVVGYKKNGVGLAKEVKQRTGIVILRCFAAAAFFTAIIAIDVATKSQIDL